MVPVVHGGDNSLDNLRPAHLSCNSARGARSLEEWRRSHPIHRGARASPSRAWLD
ncbi:HNH endonuclease [Corynebacterium accolens]|uniref:HNH endonuclease n=1 Tax=Corynebacterium accolens TaxID=38284 RepID=UPI00254CDE14|nr:HNH endonuclease [Corynebacterium accolens]MDK8674495.1 HNH endonuclease [Corynebacterium accolens]